MSSLQQLYLPKAAGAHTQGIKHLPLPQFLVYNNLKIPLFRQTPENFCVRNINVFGVPKSGKTHLVKSILIGCKKDSQLVILVAPTHTLGHDFLPNYFWIPYEDNLDYIITTLESMQTARVRAHTEANKISFLSHLIDKLQITEDVTTALNAYNNQVAMMGLSEAQYKEGFVTIIARVLTKIPACELKLALNEGELKKLILVGRPVPELMVVFDDLGDVRYGKKYNELCIRYRHKHIGMIMITHDPIFVSVVARRSCQICIICNHLIFTWFHQKKEFSNPGMMDSDIACIGNMVYSDFSKYRFCLYNSQPIGSEPVFSYITKEWETTLPYYTFNSSSCIKMIEQTQWSLPERLDYLALLFDRRHII